MIAPESPLIDPFYHISATLIKSLCMIADDCFDSISWFVFECDFGREPKVEDD